MRDQLKNGARRYLKLTGATPEIDLKKVQEDARFDGKWVLRTTTSLPAEQVALAYRGLWRVENAFRMLKTPLELRPLFHTSEAGVRGHVQACVLAYALVRIIEDRLDAANLDINAKDALQQLDSIQHVTINLGATSIERTSTPNPELGPEHQEVLVELPPDALFVPDPFRVVTSAIVGGVVPSAMLIDAEGAVVWLVPYTISDTAPAYANRLTALVGDVPPDSTP
ncbi:MAG: transposase [Trueperaceae bacterium]